MPLRTYFSMLKLQVIIFRAGFQSFKLVELFKSTPRYGTKRFQKLDVLLGAAVFLLQGWTHLWHTESKPRLPAEPHCAWKPHLGEELVFHLHCWTATLFQHPPPHKPSADTCLHTHDGTWQRRCSPSSLKPSRISIPSFQWTTDQVWKRLLSGGDVEVPMLGQHSENSEVVLLNWSWHYLIKGKYKTCDLSPYNCSKQDPSCSNLTSYKQKTATTPHPSLRLQKNKTHFPCRRLYRIELRLIKCYFCIFYRCQNLKSPYNILSYRMHRLH